MKEKAESNYKGHYSITDYTRIVKQFHLSNRDIEKQTGVPRKVVQEMRDIYTRYLDQPGYREAKKPLIIPDLSFMVARYPRLMKGKNFSPYFFTNFSNDL